MSPLSFGFNPTNPAAAAAAFQQHQLQQMMMSSMQQANPMMNSLLAASSAASSGDGLSTPFKVKGKQVIDSVTEMISDYDKTSMEVMTLKNQLSTSASSSSRGGNYEQTISRLEEKVETLMNKNEKLMNEKSELYEKNSASLDQLSEMNSKFSRLQREVPLSPPLP
jgi:DNA repair exonuclease SbcCD ATPase subunit